MTLTLDGYDVLVRIGRNKTAFPAVKSEIAALAEALVKQELLSMRMNLPALRALAGILGEDTISLVLQTLGPEEILGLVATLDPHQTRPSNAGNSWAEGHILDLAHGRTKPAAQSKRRASGTRAAKSRPAAQKTPSPFGTASMAGKRKG